MKELTRAEEEVMQILWDIEQGFVKDVIAHFEDPKPAYNTVSTIMGIRINNHKKQNDCTKSAKHYIQKSQAKCVSRSASHFDVLL